MIHHLICYTCPTSRRLVIITVVIASLLLVQVIISTERQTQRQQMAMIVSGFVSGLVFGAGFYRGEVGLGGLHLTLGTAPSMSLIKHSA